MKANTEAVPKSSPNIISTIQMKNAGVISFTTFICRLPLRSRLAKTKPAQRIMKNFASSLGWTSIKPRFNQLLFPLTLFPRWGIFTVKRSAKEIITPYCAMNFQRSKVNRERTHVIGMQMAKKIT